MVVTTDGMKQSRCGTPPSSSGSSSSDGRSAISKVLDRLDGVQRVGSSSGYRALCPLHEDHNRSLSIDEVDGKLLVYCHAGCPTGDVLKVIGLTFNDLRVDGDYSVSQRGAVKSTYDYRDERGNLLFQVVRYEPKAFRQRRPVRTDAGGNVIEWSWKVKETRKVLYKLPELLKSGKKGRESPAVFVVEGEKSADRLSKLGLIATCSPGGAGKWRDEYGEFLKGRKVVILPDNDAAGMDHAQDVRSKLSASGVESVQVLDLPGLPEKGDVCDWLNAGGTAGALKATVKVVKIKDSPISFKDLSRSFGRLREATVESISREGETVNIIAPPKVGKSWLAWSLAISVSSGKPWLGRFKVKKGRVLLVDNELHPETIAFRGNEVATALGVDVRDVDVLVLRGRQTDYKGLEKRLRGIKAGTYQVIIIDSHYRMLPGGISENDNASMKDVYNLIDKLADDSMSTWFLVHHSSKGDQNEKGVTDVGAGAGSQARAADSHLILRKHAEDGAYVLEAAVRSFKPTKPVVLKWEFPVWKMAKDLDPVHLETRNTKVRKRMDDEGKATILKLLKEFEAKNGPSRSLTSNGVKNKLNMGEGRCKKLLDGLVRDGKVKKQKVIVSGNETYSFRVM